MKTIFDFGWEITKSHRGNDILEHFKKNRSVFVNGNNLILKVYLGKNYQVVELGFKKEEIIALADYLKTLDTDAE
jgi:hypothetical protein